MNLRLEKPAPAHEKAAIKLLAEFRAAGEAYVYGAGGLQSCETYGEWLKSIEITPPGGVRQTTFFSFEGDVLVGTVGVRHTLNERLLQKGGNIGYSIRPALRRMGYGKEQLRLALGVCRELGISRALVTCNESNAASAATIQALDGMEDRPHREPDGTVYRRFWIATGEPDDAAPNSVL